MHSKRPIRIRTSFCKYNTDISGSPSGKNFSILDMLNASEDPIREESFRRLLNEFATLSRISLGRSRPARRQQARRSRRMSSAEAGERRKLKYARQSYADQPDN